MSEYIDCPDLDFNPDSDTKNMYFTKGCKDTKKHNKKVQRRVVIKCQNTNKRSL